MRRGRCLVLTTSLFLGGCLKTLDTPSLEAVSLERPAGMGCSECHLYALKDKNHFTHLMYNEGIYVKQANGFVTCLDCHRTSLQFTTETLFDSVYQDSNGTLWSTIDFKGSGQKVPGALIRVDTLVQHHPIPLNDKPVKEGELQEWMTGMAHLNGKVDVVFDSSVNDTARFHGARAEFNPKLETCSAVSCHSRDGLYRFEACSKGLPELAGETEPSYQCSGVQGEASTR